MKFFKWESPRTVQATPAQEKGYGSQRPTIFSHLSEHDLSQLYHAATIKHFQKDQCVIREGDECSYLYIILEGLVRINYKNNTYASILHGGDCFGDMAFQENGVSTYSAIAVEHVTLMEMNHSMVDHLPDSVQLTIYKKLSKSSMQTMYYLSTHHNQVNKRNTELIAYIRHMKSQTDAFITSEVFQNIIKNMTLFISHSCYAAIFKMAVSWPRIGTALMLCEYEGCSNIRA